MELPLYSAEIHKVKLLELFKFLRSWPKLSIYALIVLLYSEYALIVISITAKSTYVADIIKLFGPHTKFQKFGEKFEKSYALVQFLKNIFVIDVF